MEVYLIRHTTPLIEKGICYGQSDIPLSSTFKLEAKSILKKLPQSFDVVYSSPLSRCFKLAELIKTKRLITDKRLLELDFGDWEMKKWNEIDQKLLNGWMDNYSLQPAPHGESYADLNKRVISFLNFLSGQNAKKIAIVTHHGVIRSFMAGVNKLTIDEIFKITFPYGSITKFEL